MTLGEKIQANRKRLGMSQEQLGQELNVSRQTVSLWETDRTMPTVDNLVILRDIFGVSVDAMLFEEKETEDVPLEHYRYKIGEKDLKEIFGAAGSFSWIHLLLFSVAFLIFAISFQFSGYTDSFMWTFAGMMLMYIVFGAVLLVSSRRVRRMSSESVLKTDYECEVYENGFELRFFENGRLTGSRSYEFSGLGEIRETANFFLIRNLNQFYIIPKNALGTSSRLKTALSARVNELSLKKPEKKLKLLATLLTFGAVISLIAACTMLLAVNSNLFTPISSGVIPLLFLPLPIASVVFGIFLMKRRFVFKPNVVSGFVCAVALCTFAFIGFQAEKPLSFYSNLTEYKYIQEIVGMELPEAEEINYVNYADMEQLGDESFMYSACMLRYSDEDTKRLAKQLGSDQRWLKKAPEALLDTVPYKVRPYYDLAAFYDIDNERYNAAPKKNSSSEYVALFFCDEENIIYAFEYIV